MSSLAALMMTNEMLLLYGHHLNKSVWSMIRPTWVLDGPHVSSLTLQLSRNHLSGKILCYPIDALNAFGVKLSVFFPLFLRVTEGGKVADFMYTERDHKDTPFRLGINMCIG